MVYRLKHGKTFKIMSGLRDQMIKNKALRNWGRISSSTTYHRNLGWVCICVFLISLSIVCVSTVYALVISSDCVTQLSWAFTNPIQLENILTTSGWSVYTVCICMCVFCTKAWRNILSTQPVKVLHVWYFWVSII